MREKVIIFLRKIEMTGVYLLIFFLPFLKVPKNIGIVLFIIGAIGWRIADKSIKLRKPDTFECILLTIFFIALGSTVLNWPLPKGVNGLRDTLNFTGIAWLFYINSYSKKQIKIILWLMVSGASIGLVWGFWEWNTGVSGHFEFRRMMVAETSIITGMVVAALVGVLFDTVSVFKKYERLLAAILAILFLLSLFLMGNRSGLLGFAVFIALLIPKFITNKKSLIVLFVVFSSLLTTSYLFTSEQGKTTKRIGHLFSTRIDINTLSMESLSNNDRFRFAYWRLAWAQASESGKLFFGVGPRNFSSIDVNDFTFDPPLFMKYRLHKPVHAHNVYLTKLCEEGLLGLLAMLVLWFHILWVLLTSHEGKNKIHWTWIACLGAIVIPAIAGIFYTPYRREVAWVSLMFVGLAANYIKRNQMKVRSTDTQ